MTLYPLFTGAQSLKSSGASSVKAAKIVAVAQSKLTFIKPVQTGNGWQILSNQRLWCVKGHFAVYLQIVFNFVHLLFSSSHTETPDAVCCEEHVL